MKFAALTLATLALLAAGCGGDDDEGGEPIPTDDAQAMLAQLDLVEDRSDRGLCGSANTQIDQLEEKAAALPRDVDPDVRSALDDGLERLRDLVDDECGQDEEQQDTDTTETEPPPTETQETEPEETETEPEETETEPPPTETEPPPTETLPEPPLPGEDGGTPPGQSGQAPGRGGDG